MAGRIRGLLAALLAIMMALGVAPGAALADGDKTVESLGTAGIAATNDKFSGSYVYFGTYDGTDPTRYRVLDNDTGAFGGRTMLLDGDTVLETMVYHDSSNEWATSNVKAWVQGESFLAKQGNFTTQESAAIAASSKGASGYDYGLSGEKAFVLSVGEANTYYANDGARKKTGGGGYWWLRSAGEDPEPGETNAAVVDDDGYVDDYGYGVNDRWISIGVSPAFNVNLSSVIFSSKVSDREYKLTIKDPDLAAFGSATLDGTKATVTYATDGAAGQASYLVTDKAWSDSDGWPADAKVLAYGRLGDPGEQKGAFELPDGCAADGWGTDYHVYVLAENVSEGSATDYASAPEKIKKVTPEPTPAPTPEPVPADVPPVSVTAHVQRKGTLTAVSGGAIAGTTGKSLRMESVRLTVDGASATGGIEYRSHVQRKGWEKAFVRDGKLSGTEGKSRRMEAVQIRLWGDMAAKYDVYYRVHVQKYGWMAWAKNGQSAGTQGMSRRVEAIQVVLVAKDGPAPAKALKGATQQYAKAFVKK